MTEKTDWPAIIKFLADKVSILSEGQIVIGLHGDKIVVGRREDGMMTKQIHNHTENFLLRTVTMKEAVAIADQNFERVEKRPTKGGPVPIGTRVRPTRYIDTPISPTWTSGISMATR